MEPKTASNYFFDAQTDRQTLGLIEVPSRNLKIQGTVRAPWGPSSISAIAELVFQIAPRSKERRIA